jgi:HEAT repeat protein
LLRRIAVLLALILGASVPVHSQGRLGAERLQRLKAEWRKLDATPGFGFQRQERLRILQDMARINDRRALQFLLDKARDPRLLILQVEILRLLARYLPEEDEVGFLFREHMTPGDPHRILARDFLLKRALRKRDDVWFNALFAMGPDVEDRFVALRGMGEIGSASVLEAAESLTRNGSWKPDDKGVVNCGTIAAALKDAEGPRAARLLLLLQKDARFRPGDARALREATRLWAHSDLRSYIAMTDLATPDLEERARSAEFMGRAGIEAARAPLIHLAFDRGEAARVRAAATTALGGLTIARGDLVRQLAELLQEDVKEVQVAAIEGLGRLRVRQAAELLAKLLDGPYGEPALRALTALSGLPPETDWRRWVASPLCPLSQGT